MNRYLWRVIVTIVLLGIWSVVALAVSIPSTLMSGQAAGQQFQSSDTAYAVSILSMHAANWPSIVIGFIFLLILVAVWWRPLREIIAGVTAAAILFCFAPSPAHAYYDQSDYNESYFILPNESAFWIPDIGDNKSSQAQFGSVDYYKENKIAAKRFTVPHTKLPNSGLWSNFYVPSGRLIIVDRTPYAREWTKPGRGTNAHADESLRCQTNEGLDFFVGVTIATYVTEDNAPKFLYTFGTKPPVGDRTDPKVIFTSLFYGKSLTDVMDTVVKARVQALVCEQVMSRDMVTANKDMTPMMAAIQKAVGDYLAGRGITLDFIGWGDTVDYSNEVQTAINRRFIADRDAEIAKTLDGKTPTIQAMANAEATRTIASKWNGSLPNQVSLWWLPSGLSDWLTGMFNKK